MERKKLSMSKSRLGRLFKSSFRQSDSETAERRELRKTREDSVPSDTEYPPKVEIVHHITSKTAVLSETPSASADNGHENAAGNRIKGTAAISERIHSPAFEQACSKLSIEQKQALKSLERNELQSPQDLFVLLSHANDKHRSESWFRQGLQKMAPLLNGLQFCMEFTSPLAALEPTVSLAFGLVKSVIAISIGLCGASEDLSDRICLLLECIPAIDRCDQVVQMGRSIQVIQKALALVYGDLLDFYFEVDNILNSSNLFVALAKSQFRQRLSGIISSFSTHTDDLSMSIHIETYGNVVETGQLVQMISNKQDEEFIQKHLHCGREKENDFLNRLEKRADGTCQWLGSAPQFCRWRRQSPPNANFLSMVGDVGCGKTMTTAYVVDVLRSSFGPTCYREAIICFYYCSNDGERNKSTNIYRSLLSQLLAYRPQLKKRFSSWFNDIKSKTTPMEPTQSREELRRFFTDLVCALDQWLFVVIDAIDECEQDSWRDILEDCRILSEKQSRFKVFLSSRYNDDIKWMMPEETVHLQLQPSKEEDHLIATHLVDRYLPKGRHNEEVRQTVVEKVSENANGSAIWIKMVLEYLRNRHMTNPETMLNALQTVPSKLSEVYGKIFDQIVEREATNQRIIEQALEILAVACRPLTLRELSAAIALDANGEKFTRLSQLEAYVDHQMVLDLTRPFISTEGSANSIVRLVHHSLKELILQKPPRTWTSDWKVPNRTANTGHVRRMHDILSTRCIQYLRLSELGEKELFPKGRLETGEGDQMFSAFSLFDDEDEAPGKTDHPSSPIRAQHVREFEPSTEGFGDFFTYAACYWPHHVRSSSDDTSPEPQDLMALASAGSTLLRNWSEQYRRPSCSYSEEQYLPPFKALDPLVIAAYFGHESTVIQLLENFSVKTTDFTSDSAWTATDWALQNGQVSIVRGIFERTGTTLHNWEFFYQVLTRWRDLKASDKDRWDPFFEMLINRMLDQIIERGPEILCLAAHEGCLPMIRKLFEVGAKIPKLRHAILEDRDREGKHQSVGEAAWWGHADIIHFLCQQDGIEKHLFHRGPKNETVFHAAARFGNPEVFRILLKYYPEGVDLEDDYDTPLHTLISRKHQGFEAVELLLKTGMVDPNAVTDNGTSPLSTAVNNSAIEMIRTLVAGGADVNSVLGIAANGQRYLKVKPAFLENEERILNELCQLIGAAQPPQRV